MGVNDFIKIGDRIKQLRKERGISQKKMAERLGINVSTYSNYENNYREPSSETITKIAEKLNITIPYMLYGVEDGENYSNFQCFIDYCATLGFSIETCVSDPELSSEHYIRLNDDRIYVVSQEELTKIKEDVNRFIEFVFNSMFNAIDNSSDNDGSLKHELSNPNPPQSLLDNPKSDSPKLSGDQPKK